MPVESELMIKRTSILCACDTVEPSKYKAEDITARIIGDFGRWQLKIGVLMTLLKFPMAWYQLNIIFMAPPQDFWCEKPDSFAAYSDEEWKQICAPRLEEHPCLIFDPDLLALSPNMDKKLIPLVRCKKFVYNRTVFSRTITSDWDLVCTKHWLVHLTQCIMMWGILVGSVLFGKLADKYGRKQPLMFGILIQAITSYIACFLTCYWMFLTNWFILALASGGISIISFVLCMEGVSGKYRTTVPVIFQLPFGLGNAVMAGLAYWLRDWRKLEFALSTLSSLYILYWFYIPESPRWLLATGQPKKALSVLRKAAIQNGKGLNPKDIRFLLRKSKTHKVKGPGFITFLKSKNMRLKTVLLSIIWFCTGLTFYAFSQYVGSIGENIFATVAFSGVLSSFGSITCVFIITRAGRKTTITIYQFITAVCFLMLLVIPRDMFSNDWPRLMFAGIGFAGMSGTIPGLYLLSGELFPTLGRNVGVSGVTTFARIASMIASAVVNLDSIMPNLTLILLAIISAAQILLILPLPETKDRALPDTLEEAQEF